MPCARPLHMVQATRDLQLSTYAPSARGRPFGFQALAMLAF